MRHFVQISSVTIIVNTTLSLVRKKSENITRIPTPLGEPKFEVFVFLKVRETSLAQNSHFFQRKDGEMVSASTTVILLKIFVSRPVQMVITKSSTEHMLRPDSVSEVHSLGVVHLEMSFCESFLIDLVNKRRLIGIFFVRLEEQGRAFVISVDDLPTIMESASQGIHGESRLA
jgi:hypothetical protein